MNEEMKARVETVLFQTENEITYFKKRLERDRNELLRYVSRTDELSIYDHISAINKRLQESKVKLEMLIKQKEMLTWVLTGE